MPYVDKLISLLTEVKGWLFAVIGIVTVVVVIKHGIEYQQGTSTEKADAMAHIKKAIYMGGGIFFLAWFATYVISKMQ